MTNRSSVLDVLVSQYNDSIAPDILEANILHENNLVYFEIIKTSGGDDRIVYKYALKDWDTGPTYTAEELGISPNDDFSDEVTENPHFSMPLFSPENDIHVSFDQFVDLFIVEKETLMNLTELFDVDKID